MPPVFAGMNWIAGGAVAAILLPLLVISVGMPFWIAGIISVSAGGGLVFLFSPRKPFEQLDLSGAARGKIEFARELLTCAEPLAARLEVSVRAIRAPEIADRVRHLTVVSREIFAAIEKDPSRVDLMRRFLTYYLPRAAEIAEAYGSLERGSVPDIARITATAELINRLDVAFTRYASNLQGADLGNLDIELKLLKSSLDEDLGASPQLGAAPDPGKRRA